MIISALRQKTSGSCSEQVRLEQVLIKMNKTNGKRGNMPVSVVDISESCVLVWYAGRISGGERCS